MSILDTHSDRLIVHTCWCGVRHAIPSSLSGQATQNQQSVYCPLGHKWVLRESEVDRLKKQLARERAQRDQDEALLRDQAEHHKNCARAQKAAKTRIKNRIAKGVCPCCNRHFKNLAAHMNTQHPDFTPDSDD